MNNKRYGFHSVQSILDSNPQDILKIYISEDRDDKRLSYILKKIFELNIPVIEVNKNFLKKLVNTDKNQGIVAEVKKSQVYNETFLEDLLINKSELFLLILDGITDIHNLGACIRTAETAGVDAIVVPKDRSASINASVHKISSGASDIVPLIKVTNLARTMRFLRDNNFFIIGTTGDTSNNIYQQDFSNLSLKALVMGNEETGLRRLTKENCDILVKIPMSGIISSLNISVATGVCLFEIKRQSLY